MFVEGGSRSETDEVFHPLFNRNYIKLKLLRNFFNIYIETFCRNIKILVE